MDDARLFCLVLRREHRKGNSAEDLALMFGIPEAAVIQYLEIAQRGCCDEPVCPRVEFERLLTPDESFERQVDRFARAVAETCSNAGVDDLRACFSRCFQLSSDCELFDRFRDGYEKARR